MQLIMSRVGKKKKNLDLLDSQLFPAGDEPDPFTWEKFNSPPPQKKKSPLIYNEKANAETERPALLTGAALGPRV